MTDNNQNPKPAEENNSLIQEILQLMELSTMQEDEKTMWTLFLPSMIKPELEKFKAVLEKEITQLADIYMKAKQKRT